MDEKKKDMTLEQVREEEKRENEVLELRDEQLESIAGGTQPTINPFS